MMKIIRRFILIPITVIILFTLLLCSCDDRRLSSSLDYQEFPFTMTGSLVFDEADYSITVEAESEDSFSVKFHLPEELTGFTFLCDKGETYISYGDISIPILDSDYFMENGILLIKKMFSQTREDLIGISIENVNGKDLNASEYNIENGKITVYSSQDKKLPVQIRLVIPGHEMTFCPQEQN